MEPTAARMFPAICMIFFLALESQIPQMDCTKDGMEFRPMFSDSDMNNRFIWVKTTDRDNVKQWADKLDNFLQVYRTAGITPGRGQNIVSCDYRHPPGPGQVCDVDVKNWSPCISENLYNYHRSAPCIFLRLNKDSKWVPEYHNDTEHLPSNMPEDLKEYIKSQSQVDQKSLNTVWLSCNGVYPADMENIGPVEYIPRRGFPGFFFPHKNAEGYFGPLVAIQLQRPKIGVVINIECKTWTHNYNGTINFEILLD